MEDILLPHFNHWIYPVLFALLVLETGAALGFLLPGEAVLLTAGLLAASGALDLSTVLWTAAAGAAVGDSLGFFAGHRLGRGILLRYRRYLLVSERHVEGTVRLFERYGGRLVFFGRLLPWLRALVPVVAGRAPMHYARFLLYDLPACVLAATLPALLGFLIEQTWEQAGEWLGVAGVGLIGAALLLTLAGVLVLRRRKAVRSVLLAAEGFFQRHAPWTWNFARQRFATGVWYGLGLTAALVVVVLSTYSFLAITEGWAEQEMLYRTDQRVERLVDETRSPGFTRVMRLTTYLGDRRFATAVSLGLLAWFVYRRDRWRILALFLVMGAGALLLFALKLFFGRERPLSDIVSATGYSFPSGHTFAAVTLFGFLAHLAWTTFRNEEARFAAALAAAVVTLLVGLSRIYLAAHWFSDVLGSLTLGLGWLVFSLVLVRAVRERSGGVEERRSGERSGAKP